MASVDKVTIESDERGFEMWLELDEEVCTFATSGVLRLNIHGVAEELYDAVKSTIGPWLQERDEAKREYDRAGGHPLCPDEDGHCIHGRDDECPRIDTEARQAEAMRDWADHARKVEKGE